MIVLENVSKSVMSGKIRRNVALDINLRLQPGQTLALLGRNGAGKSMLMQMIAGLVLPDRGRIRVSGSVSWPVGFNGSFHRDLSGAQNARFWRVSMVLIRGNIWISCRDFRSWAINFTALCAGIHPECGPGWDLRAQWGCILMLT